MKKILLTSLLLACLSFAVACGNEGDKYLGRWEARIDGGTEVASAAVIILDINRDSDGNYYIFGTANGTPISNGKQIAAALDGSNLKILMKASGTDQIIPFDEATGLIRVNGLDFKKIE